MKKKIFVLLLVLFLLTPLLAACGGDTVAPAETPVPTPEPMVPELEEDNAPAQRTEFPVRGIWENDVFTSEYLGLQFTLPDGWVAASDEEIAGVMGFAEALPATGGLTEQFWDVANVLGVHDLMVVSPITGANIQIIFERLVFPNTRMTEAQYIEGAEADAELFGIAMGIAPDLDGITIGGYNWLSHGTEMDAMGRTAYGRQFISIRDGFARLIIFTYFEGSETVEEMLAWFSSL